MRLERGVKKNDLHTGAIRGTDEPKYNISTY